MRAPALPPYRVVQRPCFGTPYTAHVIELVAGSTLVHSQLQPYSDGEVVERIRQHLGTVSGEPVAPRPFHKSERAERAARDQERNAQGGKNSWKHHRLERES